MARHLPFGRVRFSRLVSIVFLALIFIVMTALIPSGTSDAKSIKGVTRNTLEYRVVDDEAVHVPPIRIQPIEQRIKEKNRVPELREVEVERVDNGAIAQPGGLPPAIAPPINNKKMTTNGKKTTMEKQFINGQLYPKLNDEGNFIPLRRIVHLDLKGAAYRPEFFTELFFFLSKIHATGILLEWEDMFPYEGELKDAVNKNAYTMQQVEEILLSARKHRLEIIPLVQTFGHLEWILKIDKFAHLRDDPLYPQVICFPLDESWSLLTSMIDQVATVHKKYGMPFYHIGADEVMQVGVCNATSSAIIEHRTKERTILSHIGHVAKYVKDKHKTTVLAWHDMLAQSWINDIEEYALPSLLEPVIWSYAEDLDTYLPQSVWDGLRSFPRIWGSSAWKGADGPMRYTSNPIHYIRNHESWTSQMTRNYEDTMIQGILLTGWSRYDHFAILAELFPIAVPSLLMGMEIIMTGRKLNGRYPDSRDMIGCDVPIDPGYVVGCHFPGHRIYELVNKYAVLSKNLKEYRETDFEVNGWLSRLASRYNYSSAWYIQKIIPMIDYHYQPIKHLESELRIELAKIYFQDTVDEFIYTYLGEDLDWFQKKLESAKIIMERKGFEKRSFVEKQQQKNDLIV